MSEELLARIDQLEAELAEVRSTAERANSRSLDAQDTAESAEARCDDQEGEIAYNRDRANRAAERIDIALLDLQGVNLEQRITQVLSDKIADGTFNTVVVETAPAPVQATSGDWDRPIRFDVIGTGGLNVATRGTHPVVQSEQSVPADSGTGYEAVREALELPDDVAGQSETDSAEALDENY